MLFCIYPLISAHCPSIIGFSVSNAEKFSLSTLLIHRSILAINALILSSKANILLMSSNFIFPDPCSYRFNLFSCAKKSTKYATHFRVKKQRFVFRVHIRA
jgi:hypothetical protein